MLDLLSPFAGAGQARLARTIRDLLDAVLDGTGGCTPGALDDRARLEPLGFARLSLDQRPGDDLSGIYAGYLDGPERPRRIRVLTDAFGQAVVPPRAILAGLPPRTEIVLVRDDTDAGYRPLAPLPSMRHGAHRAMARTAHTLPASDAVVLPVSSPYFARLGLPLGPAPLRAGAHDPAVAALGRAMTALQRGWPGGHAAIAGVLRHVCLFDNGAQNGFATPAVHGAVFLNVALGDSVPFFVEELTHQAGHVVFTSVLRSAPPPVSVPLDTELSALATVHESDGRTVEVVLHGLVTLGLMVEALDAVHLDAPDERAEAAARAAFALLRMSHDLVRLAELSIFTDFGAALVGTLATIHDRAFRRHRDDLRHADFSGQGYNFDFPTYRRVNGLAAPEGRDVTGTPR